MELDSETRRMLLDLHKAEFEIQSTRITYWITLQYATYTIAAIGLSLLVQAFSTITLLTVILIAILIGQVFVLAMIHINQEMFTNVVYIQQRLKPRVIRLLDGVSNFWEFEDLLALERKTELVAGFEAHYVLVVIFGLVVLIGGISVIWVTIYADSWKKIHLFWLFCNACVFLMVVAKLPGFLKLQRAALGEVDRFVLPEMSEHPAGSSGPKSPTTNSQ